MECYTINSDKIITDKMLKDIYEQLNPGDELFIERTGKKFDPQTEGLMLMRTGFIHIVQISKSNIQNGYTIHCIKAEKREKLLSIIIPLYNEEATAGILLDKLINRNWPMQVEFVIVESNSKDNTRMIAQSFENNPNVTLILENAPAGKGNAVLSGIKHAHGNYIAIQDGDLEYDVDDYDKLLEPIINDKTFFVLGSRYNKDDWHMRKFSGKKSWLADYLNLGQTILTWLLNTACGCKLSDPFTMYKIFHIDCMYGINFIGGNFGLDWELVIRFIRKGYIPIEIPISYHARSYEEGKHIALIGTPIEGLKMLWHSRFSSQVYDYGKGHK